MYNYVEEVLKKHHQLFEKPQQIFNMDECGIGEDSATKRKVYRVKGQHTYHQKVFVMYFKNMFSKYYITFNI